MAQEPIMGLKIHDSDNVATVFDTVNAGAEVTVNSKSGQKQMVKAKSAIPYGHKIAVSDIASGDQITKYGEEIGVATTEIKVGDHVHVHNLDSVRARGDWNDKE